MPKAGGRRPDAGFQRCVLRPASFCVSVALLCLCGVAAADELPLPPGAPKLDAPFTLALGGQPVQAQGFETPMRADQIRAFYAKELPKRGWVIGDLPWMAHVKERQAEFLNQVEQHKAEIEQDPEAKQQIGAVDFQSVHEGAKAVLYATRSQERLLLHFDPSPQGTIVVVNRWQESASAPSSLGPGQSTAEPAPAASSAAQPQWPNANPCCSGATVPSEARRLPTSVPDYPGAQVVASGATPNPVAGGKEPVMEMYTTEDSADQVEAYYRRQLSYNGWSEIALPRGADVDPAQAFGPQGAQMHAVMLAFSKGDAICSVAVSPGTDGMLPPGIETLMKMKPKDETEQPARRTLILVNYMEAPALGQSVRNAQRHRAR